MNILNRNVLKFLKEDCINRFKTLCSDLKKKQQKA